MVARSVGGDDNRSFPPSLCNGLAFAESPGAALPPPASVEGLELGADGIVRP